jgi:hypothetical protein
MLEQQLLGHSSEQMLIARAIFAELEHSNFDTSKSWATIFLRHHYRTLLQLHSLDVVIEFFRDYYHCQHYLLDIDELISLNDIMSRTTKPDKSSGTIKILNAVGSLVTTDPRVAIIVSSLITQPFQEHIAGIES